MMRALRHAAPALLLLACGQAAAAVGPVSVSGRVTDATGRGVANLAIRVLQSRRDFKISDWQFEDHLLKQDLARTDADGFYEATFEPHPDYRGFWLRFYDPREFDAVRYAVPDDRDITARVRGRRAVVEAVVLADHPGWATVEALMREFGEGSPRAALVRQIGPPDRRDEEGGVERFWYDRRGRVYRFRGGEFLGDEAWAPPAAAPGSRD